MIAIDYKRKNIIVREFCLPIAYSVAGVLVLRNSHDHNIRGQYIWKNNKKFVDDLHWIDEKEMLDLVAIAQSAPGAIAVNGAIVIGYKLAGIAGILTAIAGTVIPPFLIISILSAGYQAFRSNQIISLMLEGMQAGVGAVIASVTYDMGAGIVKKKDALSYVLMVGAFIASCIFEVNVVYVILICGIVGVLRALIEKKITRKGSEEK